MSSQQREGGSKYIRGQLTGIRVAENGELVPYEFSRSTSGTGRSISFSVEDEVAHGVAENASLGGQRSELTRDEKGSSLKVEGAVCIDGALAHVEHGRTAEDEAHALEGASEKDSAIKVHGDADE